MAALFTLVTYIIRNAATPQFADEKGNFSPTNTPFAPNSDIAKRLKDDAPVLRLVGQIQKGKDTFKSTSLTINAGKYRHESFKISRNGSEYTLSVPEFKKGRRDAVRKVNVEAAAVKFLDSLFTAPAPTSEEKKNS